MQKNALPGERLGRAAFVVAYYSHSLLGIIFNGFCFINLIPHFFDYLMCPYYPAYTMGCYQIVIGGDNGG